MQLMLSGEQQNITLKLNHLTAKMVSDIPPHLEDLLEIATYVFIADRIVRRGSPTLPNMGSDWRRRFRFVIAVRDPAYWAEAERTAALRELLNSVSEDDFVFDFVQADKEAGVPAHLPLQSRKASAARSDRVIMFSGGLDSLAGVVQTLFETNDRLVLVSHHSSDLVLSRQRLLVSTLAERFPGRVLHVPVEITMTRGLADAEKTQRTRSFLYSAIGFVVAETMGCEEIRFYENGIMSLNLPIAAQVVGSRATRSTHPRVLANMASFANHALGHPFQVTNPYVWLTKSEVIRTLGRYGQADLIADSVSCSRTRGMGMRSHCGECAQCLHRRFGILSAGLEENDPVDNYDVELLTGARETSGPEEDGFSRAMALNLVSTALEYPHLSPVGFMSRYAGEIARALNAFGGELPDVIGRRTFELHRRYGAEVRSVLEHAVRQYAPELIDKVLAPESLLRAVLSDNRLGIAAVSPHICFVQTTSDPGLEDSRDFRRTSEIRLVLDSARRQVVIDGMGDVGTPSDFELLAVLATQYRLDRAAELKPENHKYVPTSALIEELGIQEHSLRQRLAKFRRRAATIALDRWGLPLSKDAIVQTKPWTGFRLNPDVLLIDASEVA
jgi:hypothetical protein